MRIERLDSLPVVQLEPLRLAAHSEGIRIIRALLEQYASGENCFAQPGEFLLGAKSGNGAIIGVCGLNGVSDTTARVRRCYVLPDERGHGVGSALLLEVFGRSTFPRLELRAMTPSAARFYERHGFRAVTASDHTHEKIG
jgi:N-acetylglutamate synthase-like GNAT family acetyltransferase